MKRFVALCVTLSGFCAAAVFAAEPPAQKSDEAAVKAEIEGLTKYILGAAEKLDVERSFASFSKETNGVFFVGAQSYSRDELLSFFRTMFGKGKSQSFRMSHSEVRVLGPDAALWLGWGTGRFELKSGQIIGQALTETWLWQRISGQWQVTHYHESFIDLPSGEKKSMVEGALSSFAAQLQGSQPKVKEIFIRLESFLMANPGILGSAFAFAPAHGTRKALYVFRNGTIIEKKEWPVDADYTKAEWYARAAIGTGGLIWTDPYYDKDGAGVVMVTCSIPVFAGEKKELVGVITADLPLQ